MISFSVARITIREDDVDISDSDDDDESEYKGSKASVCYCKTFTKEVYNACCFIFTKVIYWS